MSKQELIHKGLKVVLLSQLLIEANDDIKGTTMYKGKLKVFGRQFINQLASAIKQTDAVYQEDPQIFLTTTKNLEQLVEKLATHSTHELVMINQIHEHYKENTEDWNNMFGVQLEKINS